MTDAAQPAPSAPSQAAPAKHRPRTWQKVLPWAVTIVCFAYIYHALHGAAAREGLSLGTYLARSFEAVSWTRWLALMIPYSLFYLIFDSAVVWRVVNWFNTKISYTEILPIRA